MSGASQGFLEFAIKAWNNRHYIMQGRNADERTRRIYNYYNYFEGMDSPDWCELIKAIEQEFQKCANLKFNFQSYKDVSLRGYEIADMAESLSGTLDNGSSVLALLQQMPEELCQFSYYDSKNRVFRAPSTAEELIKSDPAFMFDEFLWNYTARQANMAKYRIYVTPRTVYSPKVYVYLIQMMNMFGGYPTPCSGKILIPGPETNKRADKIVLYCQNKEEMQGGVKLLNYFQHNLGQANLFENLNPRSTKPVQGLAGVAVTSQPEPDRRMMRYAGQKRVQGISFGMSRAAIIYLAMNDNCRKSGDQSIQFLNDCHRIAKIANIDIEQKRVNLEEG